MVKTVVTVTLGQKNLLDNERWDDRNNTKFNVLQDSDGDYYVSVEERTTNKGPFSFLKTRPEKNYNPIIE